MKAPYFMDSALLPCVTKYVHHHPDVSSDALTDYLIANCPEFRTKMKKKFIKSVEKAMDYVHYEMELEKKKKKAAKMKSLGISNPNSMFTNMYKANNKKIEEKEVGTLVSTPLATPDIDKIEIKLPQRKLQNDMTVKKKIPKRKIPQEDREEKTTKKIKHKFNAQQPSNVLKDLVVGQDLYCLIQEVCEGSLNSSDEWSTKSLLLSGPQNSGKTMVSHCIAQVAGASIVSIHASQLLGDNRERSGMLVEAVFGYAKSCAPCVLHISELDYLHLSKYNRNRSYVELLKLLSGYIQAFEKKKAQVLVIGEARSLEKLDDSFQNSFQEKYTMEPPSEDIRLEILQNHLPPNTLSEDDLKLLAQATSCFLPGDLIDLIKEAEKNADARHDSEVLPDCPDWGGGFLRASLSVDIPSQSVLQPTIEDLMAALKEMKPALKSEGFSSSDAKMEDIGGVEEAKQQLNKHIFYPCKSAGAVKLYHPSSVLLWGPPGCGKTSLARAMANENGLSFMSIAGPELLNMYQGETEKAVKQVFTRAAKAAPTVIFFDEIDSLCPRRKVSDGGNKTSIVNTLLVEMDGALKHHNVAVVGATNRPDVLDPAILRPGRFDVKVFIGLPDRKERLAILQAILRKRSLQPDVDLEKIAELTENFSGADLTSLCDEAEGIAAGEVISLATKMNYSEEQKKNSVINVEHRHFKEALATTKVSVSNNERRKYEKILQDRRLDHLKC